ncbi:MAG: hypothetical protein ACOVSW_18000, partial [Candidatus Kapaibacteriota bacterium]
MKISSPKVPLIYAGCAVVLGLGIEIGWWADIRILRTLIPGLPAMNPVTALFLIILGGILLAIALSPALRLFSANTPPSEIPALSAIMRLQKAVILLLASLIILFGLAQFILFFYGLPYNIDQWLFFPQMLAASKDNSPSKVAPNTALALACLSGGFAAMMLFPRKVYIAQIFAFITLGLSVFAVLVLPVALFVDIRLVYASSMSLPTVIGLSVLSLGVLSISRKHGIFLMRAEYQENRVRLPIWVKMGFATVAVLLFLTLQSAQIIVQINQLHRDNIAAQREMQMYALITRLTTLLPLYKHSIRSLPEPLSESSVDSLRAAQKHSYRTELDALFKHTDSAFMQFCTVAAAPDVQSIARIIEASRRIANTTAPPKIVPSIAHSTTTFAADSLYFASHLWLQAKMESPAQFFLKQYILNSQSLSRFIVISISGAIVLILIVMGLTAFNISNALLKIMRGTRSIAAGNFEETLSVHTGDETAV